MLSDGCLSSDGCLFNSRGEFLRITVWVLASGGDLSSNGCLLSSGGIV